MNRIIINYSNTEKTLPKRIDFSITLNTFALDNVLLKLVIGTIKKNNYTFFTNLSNHYGVITVTDNEIIKQIDSETNYAIMDYCGITNNFDGSIIACIPNKNEIDNALYAYEQFKKYIKYPEKYVENLLILKNTIESKDINTVNIEYKIHNELN